MQNVQKQARETEKYIKFTEYKQYQTENPPETSKKELPGRGSRQKLHRIEEKQHSCGAVTSLRFCMGYGREGARSASFAAVGERRIPGVVVFRVKVGLNDGKRVAEALKMHDLAFAQELERFAHIRVVNQTKQVVVGRTRLLFWYDCAGTTSA